MSLTIVVIVGWNSGYLHINTGRLETIGHDTVTTASENWSDIQTSNHQTKKRKKKEMPLQLQRASLVLR